MIVIIAAASLNSVIGKDGMLPWTLRDDLWRFRELTTGHAIIMGRKTFDSIGAPLPKRHNIVITRQQDWRAPHTTVVHSLADAIAAAQKHSDNRIFVIGGGEIYREAMDVADEIQLTLVDAVVYGDTYFPSIDPSQWRLEHRTRVRAADDANSHSFSFVTYKRRKP